MALTRTDFLLNSDGDFPLQDTVVNGIWLDTPFGESDHQHIEDGIVFDIGWVKQFPTYGFGVNNLLNSEFSQSIESGLKKVLIEDGYLVNPECVTPVDGGGFIIDSSYIARK